MDSFLTTEVFTRLAWSSYPHPLTQKHKGKMLKDIESLVNTTRLNTHTLVHTLYYYRQYLRNSKDIDASHDLFELLVVLMMIANKANDDSSYTMKTWENLTPVTTKTLKRRELVVLKRLNYDVFLKKDNYLKFVHKLRKLAIKHKIIIDSYTPPSLPQQSAQTVVVMPPLPSLTSSNPSPYFQESYPLTPRSPQYDLFQQLPPLVQQPYYTTYPTQPQQQPLKRTLEEPEPYQLSKRVCSSSITPFPVPVVAPPQPLYPFQLLTPVKMDSQGPVDHENCSCCWQTNMTNVYHNSLKIAKL